MAGVQLGGLSINNPLASQPSAAPAAAPSNNGTFWIGNNGQVIVSGSRGTNQAGAADGNTVNYWSSRGYKYLGHAAPSRAVTGGGSNNNAAPADTGGYGSASNGGGGGAVSAPQYPDKSNDISMQQAGLGQTGGTRDAGIGEIEKAWDRINGQYNDDLASAGTEYHNQTTENTKDLETNKQASLERGMQGRQGLFGTLASLGALNGTGIELANRAVQNGTNEDLTTASNTYASNQNGLDTGYNAYTQQEKRLQSAAEAAKENNEQQVKNDYYKSQQAYLTNIANDYQDEGNTAEAKNYAAQAAALFPQIAQTNVPTINMGYSGGAYTAPTLSQYVGKANNTTVQSTPGAGPNNIFNIPGLVAFNKKQG